MTLLKMRKDVRLKDEKDQRLTQAENINEPKAMLTADRNRWFAVSAILALVCLVLSVLSIAAMGKEKVVEIYWVKMYPNGRWEVQAPKADQDVEFYPNTIDHFLGKWVECRYSELKHEVTDHYGFASVFMSHELKNDFKDPAKFDAVKKAADIKSCETCPQTHISVRDINHNDAVNATFGRVNGLLYRSDVYIKKTIRNFDGSVKEETYHIVPVKWRLKAKGEIKADLLNEGGSKRLKANPVGIEIIDYKILNDHAK